MALKFNPFEVVRYEGDLKPDSRTLHTSFRNKLGDTYGVLKGKKDRMGILDYFTLGILKLARPIPYLGRFVHEVIRPFLCIILTALLSPLILLAHGIAMGVGYGKKATLLRSIISNNLNNPTTKEVAMQLKAHPIKSIQKVLDSENLKIEEKEGIISANVQDVYVILTPTERDKLIEVNPYTRSSWVTRR